MTKNNKIEEENKILFMPKKREFLSDQDVVNLFMGLVGLVKKRATEQARERSSFELSALETQNMLLKQKIKELSKGQELTL